MKDQDKIKTLENKYKYKNKLQDKILKINLEKQKYLKMIKKNLKLLWFKNKIIIKNYRNHIIFKKAMNRFNLIQIQILSQKVLYGNLSKIKE